MSIIQLPESVKDYLTDKRVRSVVDHLLGQSDDDLPPELEWKDIRAYHQAYLSAQKVKTDYALLLIDLWEAIWLPTLENHEEILKGDWTFDIMKEYEAEPSQRNLWNDKEIKKWFSYKVNDINYEFDTHFSLEQNSIKLLFRINDDEEEILPEKFNLNSLSQQWKQKTIDGYGYIATNENILTIDKDTTELDVSELVTLASEAIEKSLSFLQTRRA